MYNIQADNTVATFGSTPAATARRAQNLSLTELHIFSPSIVNEVRAGWHRFFEHEFFGTTDKPQFDVGQHHRHSGRLEGSAQLRPPDIHAPATRFPSCAASARATA